MEREYFRQRLYVGRDLLISGRTGLKQCHLTPGSLPHHLCSPFHPSMHTHTHTQKSNEASRNGDSSKPRPWLHGSHCLPRVCLSRHQIPEAPSHTGWWPSSLTASCNGSQGSHMNQWGQGKSHFWWQLVCTITLSESHFPTALRGPILTMFPSSPERRVYDLGSAASSVSQHVPPQGVGQFSKATSSRAEGSQWRQPARGDPVAGSQLSGSITGRMLSTQLLPPQLCWQVNVHNAADPAPPAQLPAVQETVPVNTLQHSDFLIPGNSN